MSDREKIFLNSIQGIEGINFHRFVETPELLKQALNDEVTYVPISSIEFVDVIGSVKWIRSILQNRSVSGEYIISFDNMPHALVTLAIDYQWIEPYWRIGKTLLRHFSTIDKAHLITFEWTESCVANSCLQALEIAHTL